MNIVRKAVIPCCLCALAGSATALGQARQADEYPAGLIHTFQMMDANRPLTEAVQAVYEVASPTDNPAGGFGNGGSTLTFDIGRFPAFPAAQGVPDPVPVSLIAFGWVTASQLQQTFDYQIQFFNTVDGAATAAPFYSGVIGTVRLNGITTPAQQPNRQLTQWFQNGLQFNDANGAPVIFNFPRDADFGFETRILAAGTNDLFPQNTGIQAYSRGGAVQLLTGSSDQRRWFDANFDGTINPDPAAAPLEVSGTNAATNRRDVYLKLRADIPAPPPPGFIDAGNLDCTVSSTVNQTVTLVPGAANFVRINLTSAADVDDSTFLDISVDSSLSAADAIMGLYNSDGNLVALDDDSGAGLDPLLTFGHGRRPGDLDGQQKDGRDGDLAAGVYFLAVSGFGAGFGSSSFNVNASGSLDAGDVIITFSTNASATANCPLPAPVAPTVNTDAGTLIDGVTSMPLTQPDFTEVVWYTFTTDFNVDAGNPTEFLDIDTLGSEAGTANRAPGLALYDSSGVLVATDSRSGPGAESQLSFRQPGNERPGVGDGEPYAGQSGSNLPAGTYYLGFGWFDAPPAVLDARASGWQVRAGTSSSGNVQINFRTAAGCRADVNADGNVDPDDLGDYINCYFSETTVPGSCPQADFTGDGGTDPDDLGDFINLYFSVTSGNPCV